MAAGSGDPGTGAAEPRLPPSHAGSVVLDVGGEIGALVVYVDAGLAGDEIQIRPAGDPHGGHHTHTDVRERRLGQLIVHAAVFASLPAGDYELDAPGGGAPRRVTITGGAVAEVDWRGPVHPGHSVGPVTRDTQ